MARATKEPKSWPPAPLLQSSEALDESPSVHRGATTNIPSTSSVPGSHGTRRVDSGAFPGLTETQRSAQGRRDDEGRRPARKGL